MKVINTFGGQNWLVAPVAPAVNQAAPATIHQQKWLMVLSGVAIVDLKGKGPGFSHETLHIIPDLFGPIEDAIRRYQIPRPPQTVASIPNFSVEQWSPFAALNAIYDDKNAVNAGFAVDSWRPAPFGSGTDAIGGGQLNNLWSGLYVDAAVSDIDGWLYRVGYNITLLGRITFAVTIIT